MSRVFQKEKPTKKSTLPSQGETSLERAPFRDAIKRKDNCGRGG
jgi:hypothetical protein